MKPRSFLFVCLSLVTLPAIAQNADSARYYLNKGISENNSRLYAVASKDFEKAIQFKPDLTEAYIWNGKTNLSMDRMAKAEENFQKAYELDPKNNEVLGQLAILTFNNHEFQKAIDLVTKASNFDGALRIMGMSYYHLEDYGKAAKFLKDAVNKNNQDAEAYYTLGRTYLQLEDEKNAIGAYLKAIDLKKDNSQWSYELGLIYYNQNDFKSALKYFDIAANTGFNKSNDFYENYGFAQIYSGDAENGVKTLGTVMEHKPGNKELINNIAFALYQSGKYNVSLLYFQKLLELNPKDAQSLYMCGMVLQKTGQKEKGEKLCDNAINLDPSLKKYRQKNSMPNGL